MVLAAFAGGFAVVGGRGAAPLLPAFLLAIGITALLFVTALAVAGFYARSARLADPKEVARLYLAAWVGGLASLGLMSLIRQPFASAAPMLLGTALACTLLALPRVLTSERRKKPRPVDDARVPAIVVGVGEVAKSLIRIANESEGLPYFVIG
ncbi:MAG: hypothetical protein M3Y55_09770, partial [Pseudomonadota bacterium]|nr:hypothetical protein [Pseudomonadota bacterium]